MKKLLLLFLILNFSFLPLSAQSFKWIDTTVDMGYASGFASPFGLCATHTGYIYSSGTYMDSMKFGASTFTTPRSMFLVKYDSSGNVIWARSAKHESGGSSVTSDSWENCYMAGGYDKYTDTTVFGKDTLTGGAFFITKCDRLGNFIWAKSVNTGIAYSTTPSNAQNGISSDGGTHVYVTSYFSGTATFGSHILTTPANTMFIAKYDSSGNAIWAKQAIVSPSGLCEGLGIKTLLNGISYVTGYFIDSAKFGSYSLYSSSMGSAFVACYDSSGNVLWAKAVAKDTSRGYAISADGNNNIYITGMFGDNTFVAKYSSSGTPLWLNQSKGGSGNFVWYATSFGIAANPLGYTCITGTYYSPAGIVFGNDTLRSPNTSDIFITAYDSSGNVLWAIDPATPPFDSYMNSGIAVATYYGNETPCTFYITGWLQTPNTFGSKYVHGNESTNTIWLTNLENACNTVTGIPEKNKKIETTLIYPNPFTNTTTVQFNEAAKHYLEVDDITGRKLEWIECKGTEYLLNRNNLASGIYLLRVFDDKENYIATSKVIVQ